MSQTPQLPMWVSYLTALAIPIIGVDQLAALGNQGLYLV